jgi:hypothetical protein
MLADQERTMSATVNVMVDRHRDRLTDSDDAVSRKSSTLILPSFDRATAEIADETLISCTPGRIASVICSLTVLDDPLDCMKEGKKTRGSAVIRSK